MMGAYSNHMQITYPYLYPDAGLDTWTRWEWASKVPLLHWMLYAVLYYTAASSPTEGILRVTSLSTRTLTGEARTIRSRQPQRWILLNRSIPHHRAVTSFLNLYLRASWSVSLRLDQTFTLIFTGTNLGLCLLFWPCSGVWILATINWQVHIWYKLHHNAILWWYSCMLLGRLR